MRVVVTECDGKKTYDIFLFYHVTSALREVGRKIRNMVSGPANLYFVGLTEHGSQYRINAIKELRELSGMGLADSKRAIDDFTGTPLLIQSNVDKVPKCDTLKLSLRR